MEQPAWTAAVAAQLDDIRVQFTGDTDLLARQVADALQKYRFTIIRGIGQDSPDRRASAIATLLYLGNQLGRVVPQTPLGDIVQDVRDFSDTDTTPDLRGYRSRGGMEPHADPCTITLLHCLNPARRGGQNFIVNSCTIHDRIAKSRPEVLEQLYKSHPRKHPQGYGYKSEGQNRFSPSIFAQRDGVISCLYDRIYMDSMTDGADAADKTRQTAALDLFDGFAVSPELVLVVELAAGETLVTHNHSVLHSRADYEDAPDAARRRHMLRVWVDAPQLFPVAEIHEHGNLFPTAAPVAPVNVP